MSARSEEFGPWIEHDGKGCPCLGMVVRVEFGDGSVVEGIAGSANSYAVDSGFEPLVSWKWAIVPTKNSLFVAGRIIRYRIRKPRGLTILQELLQDLPAPVEGVPA